jgi:hypothetical protein
LKGFERFGFGGKISQMRRLGIDRLLTTSPILV